MPNSARRLILAGLATLALAAPVSAQITPGPDPVTGTLTTAQTLSTGTGTINAGGAITIASGGNVPLTMSGAATLVNNGTIQTLGTGRAIDSTAAAANLIITNTGLISAVSTDALRVNPTNSSITLTNSGIIRVTAGGQAIDWANITTGANQLNNQAGGTITAVGDDAVRPGQNGIVINAGTIAATPTGGASPTGSDGIDLRTEKTVSVTNTGTITGRHGIATDGANVGPSSLTVNNNVGGTIQAVNGSGINVDGVSVNVTANVTNLSGATIKGGVLAVATAGDGDGIDVDGKITLINAGDVLGLGAKGAGNNAEGLAAGGGIITNNTTGRIVGSTTVGDAPNGDPTRAGNGILIDDSNGGNAVAATVVTNSGLIEGKSGFAIKIIGTFDDTVTNNADGTIKGAGTEAALQTGGGNDGVTNRGAIVSTIGNAIDLGAGDDTLKIEGGAASIAGNVSGGAGTNTLTFDLGMGNQFSFSDVLSMFGTVEVASGLVTLSGASTYTGVTRLSGGTLSLDGVGRLLPTSVLDLDGGALGVANAAGLLGQTFASFALNDDSFIDLGFTKLTFDSLGAVTAGKTLAFEDALGTPDEYAARLLGNYSSNATFLSLLGSTTINGYAAGFRTDDSYTYLIATPEPSALVLAGGLVLVLVVWRAGRRDRRRNS